MSSDPEVLRNRIRENPQDIADNVHRANEFLREHGADTLFTPVTYLEHCGFDRSEMSELLKKARYVL